MVLPQGIVRNTDEIYGALAKYPVVPIDILWKCWHGERLFSSGLLAASPRLT